MVRGVELDQLAQGRPARSRLAMTRLAVLHLPQPRRDHPTPQTVRIERTDLRVAREVLGQERGAEVMEERLPGPLQGALADRIRRCNDSSDLPEPDGSQLHPLPPRSGAAADGSAAD